MLIVGALNYISGWLKTPPQTASHLCLDGIVLDLFRWRFDFESKKINKRSRRGLLAGLRRGLRSLQTRREGTYSTVNLVHSPLSHVTCHQILSTTEFMLMSMSPGGVGIDLEWRFDFDLNR